MKSPCDIFLLELDIKIKKKITRSVLPDTLWLKRAAQSQCQKIIIDIFKWKKYYFLEEHKITTTYRAAFQREMKPTTNPYQKQNYQKLERE